jgi:GR25 family glycosyltransferase involved in LPS biosynthesis
MKKCENANNSLTNNLTNSLLKSQRGPFPTFVIIMDKHLSQWPVIENRFNQVDPNQSWFLPQKWKATDGSLLTEEDLSRVLTPRAHFDLLKPRCSHEDLGSKGAVGCFLSHRNIWKHMVDQHIPIAAIFEDDVAFHDTPNFSTHFSSGLSALDQLPNWHAFFFGYLYLNHVPSPVPLVVRGTSNLLLEKQGYFWGMQSYLLTLDGAKQLLKQSLPIDCQVDAYIGALPPTTCKVYFASKSLTGQTRQPWETNIQTFPLKSFVPRSNGWCLFLFFLLAIVIGYCAWKWKKCPLKCPPSKCWYEIPRATTRSHVENQGIFQGKNQGKKHVEVWPQG